MKAFLALALLAVLASGGSAQERTKVLLIGDSTMSDKPNPETNPERGWGQLLPRFFGDSVVVRNHAVNGRSSKSFIDEGRWEAVLRELQPGDHVFIQFGHNDQKHEDPTRHTNAHTTYRRNIARFVTETRERGGVPVLFSSIVRRHFNSHGVLVDTHGDYPAVARAVAAELGVPFVDLQLLSEELVLREGPGASKALFVWTAPGEYAMYPQGRQDDTHLSVRGATEIARLAAEALSRTDIPLARHVRLR
jgi:lysophospholipase L1-like esterase